MGDDPTADYCDAIAGVYDAECEWIHSAEFEQRVRDSIRRLDARDV